MIARYSLLLCFLFASFAQAQTPIPGHAGSIVNGAGGALLNDPFSVYVSGNYAYVASYLSNALEIVDVTNPTTPVHKGSLTNGAGGALLGTPRSIYVSGNYAYVASSGSDALEIVDVTNPANPVHKGSLTHGSGGALLSSPLSVYVSGNYAYVASTNSDALEIVDVTNPAAPIHKGSLTNGTGGALLSGPYSVHVSGNYAYVASAGSGALEIVDVTNPAAPVHKGSLTHGSGGAFLAYASSVYVFETYAFVTSRNSNALEIVDVTNPAAPLHKGSLLHGIGGALLSGPLSVYVSGNYAYVASTDNAALEIVDVTNTAAPIHKASLTDGTGGALLASPQSVYVSGNYAYVASAGNNALEVVAIFTPPLPKVVSATSVSQTSFMANWNNLANASGYFIDVSTDNFTTFVSGFNNAAQTGTSISVTGLSPATTYQYRVRASNANGVSDNSNVISVTTLPATPIAMAATSITQTGFTANWGTVNGASIYYVDVSTNFSFTAILAGYNNLSSSTNSVSVTGLNPGYTYYYRVRAANSSGVSPSSNVVSQTTIPSEPDAPSNLTFNDVTVNSIAGSFNTSSADGYLVLQRLGASPTGSPIDGIVYSDGDIIGDATVVSAYFPEFLATGLLANTVYYYDVIAFNNEGQDELTNYNTTSRLEGSRTTLQIEPPTQPTSVVFSNVNINSMDFAFTAASGADGYIVLRRSGAAPTTVPSDGVVYAVNNIIGDGTVVFVGSGTSFSQSGLTANTTYHYAVYSYKGSGVATNYLTTSPLSGNRSTLVTEPGSAPTNLNFSGFTVNSLNASFNTTTANGYIVLQKSGASPTGTPVDGTAYTLGSAIGDGTVVAVGSANTFSTSGLIANTVYHYDVIAYNGSGNTINYNTTTRLEGSRTTLQTEPTAQPTNITFTNVTTTSLNGSFTAASGTPTGYIVLRKQGSAPTGAPVDGNIYTGGQSIGDGLVVSVSNTTLFADAGLSAGTIYHYAIFSYNGFGEAINYRTASPSSASVITITTPPATSAATGAQQTSFTANWSTPTGAASYLLDVSDNNFSTLLPNYSAKPVSSTSESVTGLTPGVIYQYRVRAVNASGSSDYSNATSQITAPQTPTANAASVIRTNDFKAVWTNVLGETEYRLDVSLNNFTTYLNGFENKLIPADLTEETVTGLSPSTQYQYRVKAVNAAGPSGYSNVVTVTTLAGGGNTPLTIGNISFLDESDGLTPISVSVPITGGINSISAVVHYRGMMANAFTPLNMANTTGNTFQATIPTSALDELGLEFYIVATDGAESPTSAKNYVYRSFESTQASKIPTINKFGGKLETYQIISIPFQLEDNLIASIFEPSLGAYDKTKWRLVRFQNGKNTDYQAGLTRINQGESYWFNAVKPVEVKPGNGTAPKYNQSKPFMLKLAKGWNQIATPFPFAIDWDDILEANGNPTGIGNYKIYVPNSLSFVESNSLQPYSGGFVFADEAKDLSLPVILKNSSGGRKRTRQMGSDIGADEWLLPITLTQGNAINPMGGIGMHSRAKSGKDDFDDITLPRFVNYLEFNSYHDEFVAPRFSRDVVPTVAEYEWEISIESNFNEGDITLDWASVNFGNNNAQLILFDPVNDLMLDMKQIKNYSLPPSAKQTLRLLYFRERKLDFNNALHLGLPFPNPATGEVSFLLFDTAKARLEIIDLFGRPVYQADFALNSKQLNTIQWSGESLNSQRVSSGLYLYKLTTVSAGTSKTSQGRIIIH